MKKKKIIKQLSERIAALEKQIKPDSITITDPTNENKTVVIGIVDGKFTQDVHLKSSANEITNITNQLI